MLIRAIKLEKNNGTKRNQGTFRIDTIVQLIIKSELIMTLIRLIAINFLFVFIRLTVLILTQVTSRGVFRR